MWFLYRVLKSFSVSPMYVSEVLSSLRVTVAWQMTDDRRQFPLSGHEIFCRQLRDFLSTRLSAVSSACWDGFKMDLL